MPSAAVSDFIALARENRLLPASDLARLLDSPDDDTDLPTLCDRLLADGVLTRYQADRLRTGRGYALSFAGYPILDELSTSTFKAVDPTTRTAVLLRKVPATANGPARPPEVDHPAVLPLLDSGEVWGENYLVHPLPDGANLRALVTDMGPMPALLAVEYTRQVAAALAAVHASGVLHGGIRPDGLFVGPLVQMSRPKADGTPRYRPAPTAAVSVADLGVPPAQGTVPTEAGDVYGVGGVLFFMLTGQPAGSAALTTARPDCPPEVVAVAKHLLALDPSARPTMAEAAAKLTALIPVSNTSSRDSDAVPLGSPSGDGTPNVLLAETDQVELVGELAQASGWSAHPAMAPKPPAWGTPAFVPAAVLPVQDIEDEPDAAPSPRRSARKKPAGNPRAMLWILAGAFLAINVLAVVVWALIALNPLAKK